MRLYALGDPALFGHVRGLANPGEIIALALHKQSRHKHTHTRKFWGRCVYVCGWSYAQIRVLIYARFCGAIGRIMDKVTDGPIRRRVVLWIG